MVLATSKTGTQRGLFRTEDLPYSFPQATNIPQGEQHRSLLRQFETGCVGKRLVKRIRHNRNTHPREQNVGALYNFPIAELKRGYLHVLKKLFLMLLDCGVKCLN